MPTDLLVARVHQKAAEPGRKALRVTQLRQLAPGKKERLLDSVLCAFGVAQDPIRDRIAPVTIEVDEIAERAVVTIPRSLDEDRPHAIGLRVQGRFGCFTLH